MLKLIVTANFSAFEIDDQVLGNLREYALSNALFWALTEGHACEISARRNAMDVSITDFARKTEMLTFNRTPPRTQET